MKKNRLPAILMAALTSVSIIQTASAERPPGHWTYRGWSQGFNGNMKNWKKVTWGLGAANKKDHPNASGRGVKYFVWMADFAKVAGRHCMRIKANSYGSVDKGARVENTSVNGGHNLKRGWFETATKLSSLNTYVWPAWWTISKRSPGTKEDELDIMEYAYGGLGVKHWRHTTKRVNGKLKVDSKALVKRDWRRWNSNDVKYMKGTLVDRFNLWSVKSTSGGTRFFRNNSSIASGKSRVNYGMRLILSSGTNRFIKTPKNRDYPHFFIDYVNIWTY